MAKGLFLDRDGTLIKDIPYLDDPRLVELLPGVPTALGLAQEGGFLLFLFTNQSGIGRGYYTIEAAQACNEALVEALELGPSIFTQICIAPERPEAPPLYRKPSPKFILEMIATYGLDPQQSFMIGDRLSDVEAGLNAGIHPIRVETGMAASPQEKAWMAQGKLKSFPTLLDFIQDGLGLKALEGPFNIKDYPSN